MTYLMGILTAQLKPNKAKALGSTRAKVVKRLLIKIPPPMAFEGDREYKRVVTWLREVRISSRQWPWKNIKSCKWLKGC